LLDLENILGPPPPILMGLCVIIFSPQEQTLNHHYKSDTLRTLQESVRRKRSGNWKQPPARSSLYASIYDEHGKDNALFHVILRMAA